MCTADEFVERLYQHRSAAELAKIQRYFKTGAGQYAEHAQFIGVRMGHVFALAKEFIEMPPEEVDKLLDNPVHEVRAGALSIMGKQAARKKTNPQRRAELFHLYLRRIDRVNNWDLVDLSSHHVIGGYLVDKPRDVLYELARSESVWCRRIAIYSTLHFIRRGELDDTFRLAELLLHDEHDLIHKVTGGLLREAGKHDRPRLLRFLDRHADAMPRTMLRYAIEHLEPDQRDHYLGRTAGNA